MDFQFLCAVSLQKQIITSLLLRVLRTNAARAYSLKKWKNPWTPEESETEFKIFIYTLSYFEPMTSVLRVRMF